MAQVL